MELKKLVFNNIYNIYIIYIYIIYKGKYQKDIGSGCRRRMYSETGRVSGIHKYVAKYEK